jgi:cytochrome P450
MTLRRDNELFSTHLASQTACLLTYVTYFMAIHPNVTKRLRAEVLAHCGPNNAPTYESIRNLKYSALILHYAHVSHPKTSAPIPVVRAVINETLRLFPPVPLNVRECRASACVLPPSDHTYSESCTEPRQPLYMPGGTIFMYLPLLTQRNPVLWGEDADVFDPDRWIHPQRLAKITANPTMFTPFSAGPRIVSHPSA